MIDYYKKYLKYKKKYFKLLGGSSRGTYDKETNSCTWIIPKPDGPKEYFINFLWLSRDIEESRRQKYIIPFRNEMFLGINIIKLEYIIHLVNVIRWTELNPRAVIYFWHDSTPEIVENTRTLIEELLRNNELIASLEIVDKIIRYSSNLNYDSVFKSEYDDILIRIHQLELLEIKRIMDDVLTSQYLTYAIEYESDVSPKIKKISEIKFTEQFRELIIKISGLITFDETTGLIKIVPGIPVVIRLDNLYFRSIVELERLQKLEYTGKYLIQYFGLNTDNSIKGKYLSSSTAGLIINQPFSPYKLVIGVDLDYTKGDKIFAVDQTNSKRNFKGIVISYNKQTGELLINLIDIANGFKNIEDGKIIYKVSKLELSVFVKVDLIRLVILMEEITKNPNSYAIYADLDSRGVDEGFLFNGESIHLLDAHGLVLPLGQSQYFENSFHILAGENLTCDNSMIIAIQKILIDFNIQKIINDYTLDSQGIFSLYMDLFTYYLIIKGIYTGKIQYVRVIIESLIKSNRIDLLFPKIDPLNPTNSKIIIDKDVLLKLNIQEIGKILFSEQVSTKNIGFFQKNISIDEFKKFIPVRIDLGNLSPHRSAMAGYEKKYLLL